MILEAQGNNNKDIKVYTAKELQQILHISKNTMYKLIKTKGFPIMYIGNKILIPHNQLQQWIDDNINNHISL